MNIETTYDQHPVDRDFGPTVLIVDDEIFARDRLALALSQVDQPEQIHILHATSIPEALDILSGTLVHVVLLDKNLGPEPVSIEQNGIEAIPEILRLQPHLQILMVTGSNNIRDVVQAMNFGACGYVTKETPDSLLISNIDRAIQFATLKLDKVRRERSESAEQEDLVGSSKSFLEVIWQSDVLSESDRPILLTGDSGTGKTALARRIHKRRGRFLKQKDRPLFSVNVSSLSSELIESELFGHERGAFTDAKEMKQGLFELANNGTLFLDEIGELPLEIQPKLLTIIEEGIFMRVGGSKQLRSKPKLIFATNRDLEQMVVDGTFRKDLYMRISMFTVRMPSLEERRDDIPEIIQSVLPKACRENRVQLNFCDIPADFIEYVKNGSLDGNIRGILNQLDRLLVLSPRDRKGVPVLSKWKSIPGLYLKKKEPKQLEIKTASTPISYEELMTRPWNILGPDFPGFKEFIDLIKSRVVDEAKTKFSRNHEVSKIFKISPSSASTLLSRGSPDSNERLRSGSIFNSKEIN